ncbi:hypothetical protein BDD12DRAFT_329447 [Trichophaea hybrida]|nr:hypothetical protein BDD12DRAFT_329447 [Trichophaea hybrida]
MPYRSSSPDPLSASTAPTITEPPRRSRSPSKRCSETPVKRRFMSPSKSRSTSAVSIHSPTKMTATSNSVLSPWRIKVVVQAERDDDEEEDTSPSGRGKPGRTPPNLTLGFGGADYDDDDDMVLPPPKPRAKRSRSRSVGIRTKTTTVKVKGLSSSPEKPTMEGEEPKVAPKGRKATPARRPATPAASRRGSSSIPATISKSIAGNTPKKAPVSKPAATPKRKRTAKTPAKAKAKAPGAADRDDGKGPLTMSEETNQNMTEAPAPLPAARTEITTTVTKQAAQTTRSTRRKPQAPPTIPTLASTRSRRSTIVLSSVAGTPKSLPPKSTNKTSSVATDGSATRSVTPRRALSGMDPNSLLSPSPSKSNSTMLSPDGSKLSRRSSRHSISSSRSTKTTEEDIIVVAQPDSFRKQELDSFVVSEGGSMSLPDFQSLSFPPSLDSSIDMIDDFGDLPEQDEDMSEEEALADVSKMDSGEAPAQHSDILKPDYDFTFVSTGNSYTPRVRKKRPSPTQGSPLFHDNPVGIETFYGSNDGADDDKEEEVKDVDMESSAMLPEEFSEPAEADFTYMPNGISYTPRTKQKNGLFFSDSGSPLFKDNPVGTETFYGIPSSSSKPRDGGKGKAVDGSKGEITPEESPDHMSPSRRGVPKNQSFYPSSPPFEVVIPSPKKSIATPSLGKRNHDADVPDAPASRKRTDRETPSLIRVQEASEIMSDALDVDEAMTMAEQHFGDGFEGPPTPESKDQSPEADEEMENHSGSYANLPKIFVQSEVDDSYPSFDTTGIPSPPLSQHPEMLSPPTKTPEAVPAPPPAPAPSSGTASYFARIFSPLKRGGSSKTTNPGTKTQTPVSMSWASTGPTKTPDTIRSVRFTDEPSKAREQPRDHTADLEAEWAREREENIRKAQVVGAIMINDMTPRKMKMKKRRRTRSRSRVARY